jgi:class 3 adenylate cyclase
LNNWSIAASYGTARIFAGLGFGSSTASRSIISRPRRTGLCSGSIAERTAVALPNVAEPKPPQDTAERRQVTVMFSDLVGSTALSARMDPEDLREVISAYQKCVAETVQRFGGFVAKYMGDGVLVYFGYPQAHEDDAERAVRAGLDLNRSLRSARRRASVRSSSEPASFLYPASPPQGLPRVSWSRP